MFRCFFLLYCRTAALKSCDFIRYREGETTLNFYFFFTRVATGFLPRDILLAFFRARVQGPLAINHQPVTTN